MVSSLIKGFANSDPNGFLVYLSDHGEKSSTKPRTTVSAATKATRPAACTPVPFLVWTSLAGSRPIRADLQAPGRPDATAAKT
ncbi:sulfatase-like hydrolase/transferase [Pseudomonas aeruginosa]